jgi:dynein heavy chain
MNGSGEIMPELKLDPDYELAPVIYGCKLPEKCHMFDMFYNMEKMVWQNWSQTQPAFVIPKGIPYNELIIPTNDSIRHNYFLHLNIKNHLHCLFVGPTGTGKSINVGKELATNYYN